MNDLISDAIHIRNVILILYISFSALMILTLVLLYIYENKKINKKEKCKYKILHDDMYYILKLKYCPMCGRKLKE